MGREDDEPVIAFEPPELVWRDLKLNKPQTAKLAITSRLNASLDLSVRPAGSGVDRIRITGSKGTNDNGTFSLRLPPRGTATVDVVVAVDSSRFAPGAPRLKASTEGIRDAIGVKSLYFDAKIPATWFLDASEVAEKSQKNVAFASPSNARVAPRAAEKERVGGGGGWGHASPASLSEEEEVEAVDWGAPPSPPSPRSASKRRHDVDDEEDDVADDDGGGGAPFDGPVEVDQSWLGGVDEEEDEGRRSGSEGGELVEPLEGDDEGSFDLLPAMPVFGSSEKNDDPAHLVPSSLPPASDGTLRSAEELLEEQERRARGSRQVLRVALGDDDDEDEGATRTPAPPPRSRDASDPPPPPATAVSRAAALEAVLAQQEGANAELRARVRELSSALEEATARAAAAERRALVATMSSGGSDSCPSSDAANLSAQLSQERAERQARDAAVLKLLRAKDEAFAALEVKAADASARARAEREKRAEAERERDSLSRRLSEASRQLEAVSKAGGGTTTSAGAARAVEEGEEQHTDADSIISSLRRSLADAELRGLELEREAGEQRERAEAAAREARDSRAAADDAATRAEALSSRVAADAAGDSAVAAATAALAAAASATTDSSSAAAAAAETAALFSKYRAERHAESLRLEAAFFSGIEQRHRNPSSSSPFLPPALPPSTALDARLAIEAAIAVDAAAGSAREGAVREAAARALAARVAEEVEGATQEKKREFEEEKERAVAALAQRDSALAELRSRAAELQERLSRMSEEGAVPDARSVVDLDAEAAARVSGLSVDDVVDLLGGCPSSKLSQKPSAVTVNLTANSALGAVRDILM